MPPCHDLAYQSATASSDTFAVSAETCNNSHNPFKIRPPGAVKGLFLPPLYVLLTQQSRITAHWKRHAASPMSSHPVEMRKEEKHRK